jgi:hypothetical protein
MKKILLIKAVGQRYSLSFSRFFFYSNKVFLTVIGQYATSSWADWLEMPQLKPSAPIRNIYFVLFTVFRINKNQSFHKLSLQ